MSTYEAEIGDSLLNLATDVDHFTRNMVPQDRDAPARKCITEAAEFAADPSLDEAADVLITLLGWVTSNDHPLERLLDVAHRKMTTNLARTWQQQPDGTWQHVPGHAEPIPCYQDDESRCACETCIRQPVIQQPRPRVDDPSRSEPVRTVRP